MKSFADLTLWLAGACFLVGWVCAFAPSFVKPQFLWLHPWAIQEWILHQIPLEITAKALLFEPSPPLEQLSVQALALSLDWTKCVDTMAPGPAKSRRNGPAYACRDGTSSTMGGLADYL